MSERDPFEQLGELVDQPVAPDARFAADLKSQLMSGPATSGGNRDRSWDEEQQPMDIPYRPDLATLPKQIPRRSIKPLILLEIAAVAALLIGIAAAIGSGMFSSDPDGPATIPAAALQDDGATPTSLPPTVVPPSGAEETREAPSSGTIEPTVVPPDGLLWQLPPEGDSVELGGMAVHDGVIYRLLVMSGFAGVEAVDSASGEVLWKEKHYWSEFKLLADDDHVYFLQKPPGGVTTVVALDAGSGEESWTLELNGIPIGMALQDGTLFVEVNRNVLKAIRDGEVLWEQFIDPNDDRRQLSQIVYGINDPVTNEDTVAAMSETGFLSAFDIASGDREWTSDDAYAADTLLTVSGDTLILFHSVAPAIAPAEDGAEATPGSPESGPISEETSAVEPRTVSIGEQLSEPGTQWRATGLSLADGSELWSPDIPGLIGRIAVIDGAVAYITIEGAFDRSGTPVTPHGSILYGLDAATGEVIWSVSSEDDLFSNVGTWLPAGFQQEQFVAVTIDIDDDDFRESDSSFMVVAPESQGRTEGIESELELPRIPISQPQGDENGLYLTLEDGTLIALSPAAVMDDD